MIQSSPKTLAGLAALIAVLIVTLFVLVSPPEPSEVTGPETATPDATGDLNHSAWNALLQEYVEEDHTGLNRFAYGDVSEAHQDQLDDYVDALTAVDPDQLEESAQRAYWINLYNALTVQLVLENYPVQSITLIHEDEEAFGPWDDLVTEVNDRELSLNDIEHRILRVRWPDYRVHFAVNCASIGCPDLQDQAFTAENLEQLLDQGAEDYLSHDRAVQFQGEQLVLSSIFDWYAEDFGESFAEVLETLAEHAPDEIAEQLEDFDGDASYAYDWQLNEPL